MNNSFEYDPERLIEEVRKRPGIWNFEDAEYRAKNMRRKLWNDIVKELIQADVKVAKSEMRELEIQLQKKWKSIRDCFQKYVTNPNRSKKPYIYWKQMQFLLKDQEPPQKEEIELSSDTDDSSKRSNKTKWRRKQKLKLCKDEEISSEEENSNTVDTQDDSRDYSNDGTETAPRPAKQSKITKTPVQLDEFAFANVDAQIKIEPEDPDKMFLLSLMPHLKSIPEEFRLNVKMELMQVLRNANYNVSQHKLL